MLPGSVAALLSSASRGNDRYTKLLLHMDGANNGGVFTDSSLSAKTVTRLGSYYTTTSAQKFGATSGACAATGDAVYIAGTDPDFVFGTGDFTIDFWMRPAGVGAVGIFYDSRPANVDGIYPTIYVPATNKISLYVNAADRITGTTTIAVSTWYHVALVRYAGVTKLYVNGLQEGASYTDANNYLLGLNRPIIHNSYTGATPFNGWMDEVRVSRIARWASNFTPPVVAYQ
jgi:hypothetical protein